MPPANPLCGPLAAALDEAALPALVFAGLTIEEEGTLEMNVNVCSHIIPNSQDTYVLAALQYEVSFCLAPKAFGSDGQVL